MMKTEQEQNQRLEQLSRQALDASVEQLPDAISERLTQARKMALDKQRGLAANDRFMAKKYWLGAAASVLLVGSLWFYQAADHQQTGPTRESVAENISDNEVNPVQVGDAERHQQTGVAEDFLVALEMAQMDDEAMAVVEDLEFMVWLSQEQDTDA